MAKEIHLDDVIVEMRGHKFKTTKNAVRELLRCAEIGLEGHPEPDNAILVDELMQAFKAGLVESDFSSVDDSQKGEPNG